MKTPFSLLRLGTIALLLTSLTSCKDILEEYFPKQPDTPGLGIDIPFYALLDGVKLDSYSTKAPAERLGSTAIAGLQAGERILAIDYRPTTGQLYGVGSTSRIYVINPVSGVARAIGAGPFTPALAGNLVAFDFNPSVDRIRVVTSTGQNLRLNPETGTVAATDGSINGAAGAAITAVAYSNNRAGVAATQLFALDEQSNKLFTITPPNNGTLEPVGDLRLNISGAGGFDIDAKTGTALGLYAVNGIPTLFTVDLTTGAARPLARYARALGYTGIAIPTQPVGYAVNSLGTFLIFDPTQPFPAPNPSTTISKPITGLAAGSTGRISGMDFRPANGQLYALGEGDRLYTINAATAEATLVGTVSIPVEGGGGGFDFDPVTDRIRIVTSTGQNLRVNPADASAVADARINPGSPMIAGIAYDNNFAGATSTNLYGLDQSGNLFLINPPNAGTAVQIGSPGISTVTRDFDIGGTSNKAYALAFALSTTRLHTIDLSTGAFTRLNVELPGTTALAIGLGF